MSIDARRITLSEVAKAAGVSSATAGRALGDYGSVNADLRDHVRKVAASLGYRPNGLAKSMITGRTNTIGVVGADIENPFFASAMRGICDVARREGYNTIITNSDENVEIEKEAIRMLLEKQVDGIIVAPADTMNGQHIRDAAAMGTPIVLFDRTIAALDVDSVLSDGVKASQLAVRHLLDKGHQRIAIVGELRAGADASWLAWLDGTMPDPSLLMPSGVRLLGYIQAHREMGAAIDPSLIRAAGAYGSEQARRETHAVLGLRDPPSALFTVDNVMTIGALKAIRERGLTMPRDVSMIAYDDMEWLSFLDPPISAISQPVYSMGATAAEVLVTRISYPKAERTTRVVETILRTRGSIAALR